MIRNLLRILLIVLFINTMLPGLFSQETGSDRIRIMFYNVENFFDIYDDPLKEDNDFLPEGVMRWNYTRYSKKLNSIYKTISAAGEWEIPAIMAFCEVENRRILEDLVYKTYLSKYEIGIIHEDSPDIRGIDVCLLYRKDIAVPVSYRYLKPVSFKNENYKTRSVLYAKLLINSDTLHLFVNHWPSRRGGVLAGNEMRIRISGMVREVCDSILDRNKEGKIIICGDLNCTLDDRVIRSLLNEGKDYDLINLASGFRGKNEGTYRYKGTWEMIDQVIVSESLIQNKSGLGTEASYFRIFRPGFLLEKDPLYPGFSPFSTYRGYKYHGGYSDHLPVLLDLMVK